ncbi:MAG: hypothetical protein ACXWPK_00260 [Isosphaeraceae bacterium]
MLLKDTTANAALDKITTDAGTTAFLQIWTSVAAPSAHAFGAAGGTKLVEMAMTNPIGPASSNGVLTLSAITTTAAAASGTPGGYRICSSANDTTGAAVIAQGTCAVGSGEINFASTIASGGNVSVTTGMTVTNASAA